MAIDVAEILLHDDLLERRGIAIWIGAEPTFSRADSLHAAWTGAAEGDDKLARAHAVATGLAEAFDGDVLRIVGRRYPGEEHERFAFGVRWSPDHGDASGAARRRMRAEDDPEAPPTSAQLGGDRCLSVTPDPGVIEVNLAPSSSLADFAEQCAHVWRAAQDAGLSPLRYRFNGQQIDSGGGGQITLGGATPETSPFIRYPHVLPALVRYLNNHPSLSYWFANECVGSASQAPRVDEGTRENYDELEPALRHLEALADRGELAPDRLWLALAPLLVDAAGNSHRAEINVEKLWNPQIQPHGTRHGRMGLVELRAIRMPERPEMLIALGALLRSVVARLVVDDYREPLVDWHDELHDRFALPAALALDLRRVLGDLDEHGLGLTPRLRAELDAWRPPGIACHRAEATLTVRPALEFWPLVGDVASQERAGARIVDASTERWELAIKGPGPDLVAIGGTWAKLRDVGDGTRAIGVRRRAYEPSPGFHPGMPAQDPLVIEWMHGGRMQRITLHAWRPNGGPYDGLPADANAALARRTERIAIDIADGVDVVAHGHWPERRAFTIDLRRS